MENKRQAKFARQIQKEMGDIFLKEGQRLFGTTFISVTDVRTTPDLGLVRVYLSFLNEKDPQKVLSLVRQYTKELRMALGGRIKDLVRKIPEVEFFYDDTLEKAAHMDKLIEEANSGPKSTKPIEPGEYKDDEL